MNRRHNLIGQSWRRYHHYLLIVILSLGIISGLFFISYNFFDIREIRIIGPDIRFSIDRKKFTRQLIFFPTSKVQSQLLSGYPVLKSLEIKKKYPHTLELHLSLRDSEIIIESNGYRFLADRQGFLTGIQPAESGLPVIRIPSFKAVLYQKTDDPRILRAIELVTSLSNFDVQYSQIQPDGNILAKVEKTDILIPQEGDIKPVASTLQTLLARFRMKGTMPALIDLRFNKPVIKY